MEISALVSTWIDTIAPDLRSRSITHSAVFNSRPGMAYVSLPEAIIRYRMVGEGAQTLVFAADPPIVIEHYDELIEELRNDFGVIVFEVPGFGFSLPTRRARFDFAYANDVVAEFLRRLALGPYILAFPCVSAYGAIDIASRHPELVSGVVMIQAPSWAEEVKWKHGRDTTGLLCRPIIGQLALKALKRRRAPQWFAAAVGRQEMLTSFVQTADQAFSHGACFCLASAFQRYLTDVPPPLAPIAQPTLAVWGEADRSHRHTDKTSTKDYCPNAKEVRLASAGHFPELEEPQLFAREIREWARTVFE